MTPSCPRRVPAGGGKTTSPVAVSSAAVSDSRANLLRHSAGIDCFWSYSALRPPLSRSASRAARNFKYVLSTVRRASHPDTPRPGGVTRIPVRRKTRTSQPEPKDAITTTCPSGMSSSAAAKSTRAAAAPAWPTRPASPVSTDSTGMPIRFAADAAAFLMGTGRMNRSTSAALIPLARRASRTAAGTRESTPSSRAQRVSQK